MKRAGLISDETPLVPQAVAAAVCAEAQGWLAAPLPAAWVARLTVKAERVARRNPRFRRLLRRPGDAGRDWLWAFMRHWLAALLRRHRPALYARLPGDYARGRALAAW